jgi:hypothetical protein
MVMKTSHYLLLVALMALAAVGGLAGFMRVPAFSAGAPGPAVEFPPDESDRWDKTLADEPPLAPGAAIRIARKFMRTMRLPDSTDDWMLDRLTLQRLSLPGGPEEWVYLADFYAEPADRPAWRGPLVRLQVPVRLNGRIPETFTATISEDRRFVFWRELEAAP